MSINYNFIKKIVEEVLGDSRLLVNLNFYERKLTVIFYDISSNSYSEPKLEFYIYIEVLVYTIRPYDFLKQKFLEAL